MNILQPACIAGTSTYISKCGPVVTSMCDSLDYSPCVRAVCSAVLWPADATACSVMHAPPVAVWKGCMMDRNQFWGELCRSSHYNRIDSCPQHHLISPGTHTVLCSQSADPLSLVGGPGAAYSISVDRAVYPDSVRPSGSDLVLSAVNSSLPLDFFSFHVITPCINTPGCAIEDNGGQPTFDTRAQFARYALTQPEAMASNGRFNTTEMHCTEYYPGISAGARGPILASKYRWAVGAVCPAGLALLRSAMMLTLLYCCLTARQCFAPDPCTSGTDARASARACSSVPAALHCDVGGLHPDAERLPVLPGPDGRVHDRLGAVHASSHGQRARARGPGRQRPPGLALLQVLGRPAGRARGEGAPRRCMHAPGTLPACPRSACPHASCGTSQIACRLHMQVLSVTSILQASAAC